MSLKQRFMEVRRRKGLAESTEETYWAWAEDFIRFLHKAEGRWVYPDEWNESHVERFLTHLATNRNVSASTQNQAFSAMLFVFRDVLGKEFENVRDLLGHKDIATTQIYLHAVTPAHTRVRSPLAEVLARAPRTASETRERRAS